MGHEPIRYYECALADEKAPSEVLDAALVGDGQPVSTPLLPTRPAGVGDEVHHRLVRTIFEDIATTPVDAADEQHRLEGLAQLDRLPVETRGDVGRFLMKALAHVDGAGDGETLWSMRRFVGSAGAAHLGIGACSSGSPEHRMAFGSWVQLRHHEHQQITGEGPELITVGVLLTPRRNHRRRWDTTMIAVSGVLTFEDDDLAGLQDLWNNGNPGG